MSRPVASADIFQAIADPTRRAILDRLRSGEQPVKQLAEPFEMSKALSPRPDCSITVGIMIDSPGKVNHLFSQQNPTPSYLLEAMGELTG